MAAPQPAFKPELRSLSLDLWQTIAEQYSLLPSRPGQRTRLCDMLEAAKLPLETEAGPRMPLWTRRPDVLKHLNNVIDHLKRLKAPVASLVYNHLGHENQPRDPNTWPPGHLPDDVVWRISRNLGQQSEDNFTGEDLCYYKYDLFVIIQRLMFKFCESAEWRAYVWAFMNARDRDHFEETELEAMQAIFETYPLDDQEIICRMDYYLPREPRESGGPPRFDYLQQRQQCAPQMVDFAYRLSGTLVKAHRARLLTGNVFRAREAVADEDDEETNAGANLYDDISEDDSKHIFSSSQNQCSTSLPVLPGQTQRLADRRLRDNAEN